VRREGKINKRFFCFALSALLFALSFPSEAQEPAKVSKIGFLSALVRTTTTSANLANTFRQRLGELGWIEGQNVAIEYRYAEGKYDRLPDLAAELVRRRVDVIFANSGVAGLAAKRSTSTVPIVFEMLGDPVNSGLVASLARPGGNLTGVSGLGPELSTKQLELLKEIVPPLKKLAVLANPSNLVSVATIRETETAARSLGVKVQVVEVRELDNLEAAFVAMKRERSNALMVVADPMFGSYKERILRHIEKNRLPAIYYESDWAPDGGLMSYSPRLTDQVRKAATFVDKILKGAKPADLPVEQPTKFEFIINLKTAKQIGLAIPPSVLAQADKVIK
jgi:putative tryptophan/tyrosine transport system substrate-binding protein